MFSAAHFISSGFHRYQKELEFKLHSVCRTAWKIREGSMKIIPDRSWWFMVGVSQHHCLTTYIYTICAMESQKQKKKQIYHYVTSNVIIYNSFIILLYLFLLSSLILSLRNTTFHLFLTLSFSNSILSLCI